MKTKLILSIRSLDIGGAERQFIEIVKHIDKSRFDVTVCSMYGGSQENIIEKIEGVRYINLNKKGRYDIFNFYKRYKSLLREIQPDIIYSFLGEMNLFSLWCKPKKTKLIWGFRASNMNLKQYGRVSQLLFWLQKILSSKIDKIIANSYDSIAFHKKEGFFMDRATVVANGIDIDRFRRDNTKRVAFRKQYNLKDSDIAVGIVARIDYMKGYTIFAKATKEILDRYDNIYFFAVGGGDLAIKKECEEILAEYNNIKFIWLGEQKDVESFYSGFDISVSSSLGESFSNSIAEAMSCGVPCVVTDVGDSAIIVGDCGTVVKPNSIKELVRGIEELLQKDLKRLNRCSRERIVKNFSIDNMIKKTETELLELL